MNIQDFCEKYGRAARGIHEIRQQWQAEEVELTLRTLRHEHDRLIGNAVILGDALHGDGMLDQIPTELSDAFANLMSQKASSYDEMRQILLRTIRNPEGGFLSFDDHRVRGFISKLKGQIGENIFQRHVGTAAYLAKSGRQEGWDVAVKQVGGGYAYIQVKLYETPSDVVRQMRHVQSKVAQGLISGWQEGEFVGRIDFAVPESITEQVGQLAKECPELQSIKVLPIPVSTTEAAELVKEGLSNVGPGELRHFFGELLAGAITAGAIHAIVNGFLWYKGAKDLAEAITSATASTALSTTSIGIGLIAESFFHTAFVSGTVGVGTRYFLNRLAHSRWNFADFLEISISQTRNHVSVLQTLYPNPSNQA